MKTCLLLPLAAALLTASSCKKDAPDAGLPPATQVGANTAGCLINGQTFVPKAYGGSPLSSPIPALEGGFYFDSLYYLSLNGQLNGQGISVTLFLRRPKSGVFLLNRNTQFYPQGVSLYVLNHATYRISGAAGGETYVTNARHTGRVEFTKADKPSGLSAGTFSFSAVSNKDSTKTITIENGRFDRKQ